MEVAITLSWRSLAVARALASSTQAGDVLAKDPTGS
jgi:hypothetical protein